MALTKSYTAIQASASNSAGATTNSTAIDIDYGVSIIVSITNGGTGPSAPCAAILQVSDDGATWFEKARFTAGVASSTTYRGVFDLGVAGLGGDWTEVRVQFTGNTGQAVTIQADASKVTAL